MRLFLPGWEGNISIKWLRRLEVSDKPFYTREETSKYTDLITKTGKARIFTFTMEAKSAITFPSGEMNLPGPGFYEITGLAWSGRGKIARVEISTDGGRSWRLAACRTRCCRSRRRDFGSRGRGPLESGPLFYHMNAVQSWAIAADGSVKNVHPFG